MKSKFWINHVNFQIAGLYKQCMKGVTVKLDDDMLKHYCNEDTFIIEIEQASDDPSCCTVTLIELPSSSQIAPQQQQQPPSSHYTQSS